MGGGAWETQSNVRVANSLWEEWSDGVPDVLCVRAVEESVGCGFFDGVVECMLAE